MAIAASTTTPPPKAEAAPASTAPAGPAPAPHPVAGSSAEQVQQRLQLWDHLCVQTKRLLRVDAIDGAWVESLQLMTAAARDTANQNPDLALFVLIQATASGPMDHYSEQHALASLVVCELAARWMDWSVHERQALALAAMSMNLSMTVLQNTLAEQKGPMTAAQRERVAGHAAASAQMLQDAGVDDALWLHAVRHHHVAAGASDVAGDEAATRLAELLRRVDVYTAKLSRRGSRGSITPALAARDACLGPGGHPDSIGATLLRVIGLYPPGTYVELANGETAVVVHRGDKAHTPVVASLRRPDWGLIAPPLRRDTARPGLAVRHGVEPGQVKVLIDAARVLGCA